MESFGTVDRGEVFVNMKLPGFRQHLLNQCVSLIVDRSIVVAGASRATVLR